MRFEQLKWPINRQMHRYIQFSSTHGSFIKIGHSQGHRTISGSDENSCFYLSSKKIADLPQKDAKNRNKWY